VSVNKRNGTAWETRSVRHMVETWGFDAYRVAGQGSNDVGDVHLRVGPLRLVCQNKAVKAIDLAGFMKAVDEQTTRARADAGFALIKARNKPVGKGYVVLELDQFLKILAHVEGSG